jgi:hypothetical protein
MSETYTPTDGMQSAAKRALKWKEEGRRGGTSVGLARANQLAKKQKLSESTVLRMYSFFARHEVDKKAKGFRSGEEGFPSPGRVAWDLWGGDAGASWSKQKRDQIERRKMKKSVWSGVFFPADEPEVMEVEVEDEGAPEVDIVDRENVSLEREDISEDTSVTNEVEETPEIIDTETSEETEVSENSEDSEDSENSEDPESE